ncbi:MAG: archaemetzincin [Planctomycetes bacterium]|nr:archaemetzincin [Planctomycetota bacterium]
MSPSALSPSALAFRAVGAIAQPLLRDVVTRVSRMVGLPCRALALDDEVRTASVVGRKQWDADRLLAELEMRAEALAVPPIGAPGTVLVGLAAEDMGNAIFTHFFGRARIGGGAVVVSVARLSPTFYGMPDDPDLTARRASLEVLHELAHVAGLRHCTLPNCLMRLAHNVEAIDLRGGAFCAECASRLPRHFLAG